MHLLIASVMNGDICDQNICINDSSIQVLDFGEKAPGYTNDVVATGHLLRLCVDRVTFRDGQKGKILEAATALIEREDVTLAAEILEQSVCKDVTLEIS